MSRYAGCHGILVRPEDEGLTYGWSSTRPPRTATVLHDASPGDLDPAAAIWSQPTAAGNLAVNLWGAPDGRIGYEMSSGVHLEIDLATSTVRSTASVEAQRLRSVVTIGFGAIAQAAGGLVLHAACVARGDNATLLCGRSGQGKSSLHLRLIAAGCDSVSDDLCVVDFDDGVPMVWPGPPWARVRRGTPAPLALPIRFPDDGKEALDLDSVLRRSPVRVGTVVVIQRENAGDVEIRELSVGETIGRLSPHAPWLLHPDDGPAALFGSVTRLARSARGVELRVPEGGLDDATSAVRNICYGDTLG